MILDRLSNWVEVLKAPVGSMQSGANGLCSYLRDFFSKFGVPVTISSDGGNEFVADETQDFSSEGDSSMDYPLLIMRKVMVEPRSQ